MMDYAIKKAAEQEYIRGQARVYAVIVSKQGRVLAEAANQYTKTHPQQAFHACRVGLPEKITLHAEIAALVRVKRDQPYKIYVARVDVDGNPKLAKPCPVCYDAIKYAGVTLVEHTVG